MAKIGNLQVDTIKIANGTLTQFFTPTSSNTVLTITNESGNPTFIFFSANAGGSIVRDSDSQLISSLAAGIWGMAADVSPLTGSQTYSITGVGNVFTGAMYRKA